MNKRQCGFTLIELMVGLTLVGLIVAVLAGAVRTGLFGANVVDERSQAIGDIRLAHRLIRRQVETARPVSWSDDRRTRIAFDGTAERLDFITVISPQPGQGGPYAVRIAREGDALVMSLQISSGEAHAFDFSRHTERTVIMEGVRAVHFAYFGTDVRDSNAKWWASWTGRDRLPQAVKVQIDFAGDHRAVWPELVVPLMIGPVRP